MFWEVLLRKYSYRIRLGKNELLVTTFAYSSATLQKKMFSFSFLNKDYSKPTF